jgi:hypothetical protein
MPPPPMLRTLDVGDYEAVTDDVMELAVQATLMNCATDVQDRLLSPCDFECLVLTCASSEQDLNVAFVPNVTDADLATQDKVSTQHENHHLGCAQLTDEFLDGHRRVDDTLELNGVWMKKNLPPPFVRILTA